jgi:valyl-tRNA synthetase
MAELSPSYEPTEVEAKWYPIWTEHKLFVADPHKSGKPFTIMMPPPNITGALHMGHALTATIEDTLSRWHRMSGRNTLWLPGTDHAGIATQMVVERELKKEGLSRHTLGRAKFLERVWEWKEKSGSRIEEQHRVLGASVDWTRNNFTMSPKLSRAVKEVFVRLHDEGLIYRDERLINWCPSCLTALSDLEVDHEEGVKSSMWHLKYPVKGQPGRFVTVATTRPETMLGDTAVAVHSTDARYTDLQGKSLELPLTGREIPIVVDDILVDPEFGSGAVKVTPAHDFNDFQVGKRHKLGAVRVLDVHGKIALPGSPFHGLDRYKARTAIVKALEDLGLLDHIDPHTLSIGRCDRCKTVVEPYLSPQWYVKTKPLAEPALEAVRSGKTKIVPEHWTKTYEHWMTNIQDWCISRQLWWGHQIPAYYCRSCNADFLVKGDNGEVTVATGAQAVVARDMPTKCAKCGGADFAQDPDVLDTWFSSGLWPFSTLGWPDKTADLETYYPNSVMETGSDILFFWVARMMMMGIHFMGKPPFETIYLHSIVRDEHGEKMSKTKGNGVDPLDLVYGVKKEDIGTKLSKQQQKTFPDGWPAFGVDAMRMTLATATAAGRDIKLNLEQMQGYRAFCNKIWNAVRFALMNLSAQPQSENYPAMSAYKPRLGIPDSGILADRWIRSRLAHTVDAMNASLHELDFSQAALAAYHFFWNELCDWYLELIKPVLRQDNDQRQATLHNMVYIYDQTLRLLHPFMPYITEELWQHLPHGHADAKFLAVSKYPSGLKYKDEEAERKVALLIDALTAIRNIRGEQQLPPSKMFPAEIHADPMTLAVLQEHVIDIERLAMVKPVSFKPSGSPKPEFAAVSLVGKVEGVVSLEGLIDWAKEAERLKREQTKLNGEADRLRAKLGNEGFLARAPADVIAKDKEKLAETDLQIAKLDAAIAKIPK